MGTHMVLVETSAMVRVESLKGLWTFHWMPASFQYSNSGIQIQFQAQKSHIQEINHHPICQTPGMCDINPSVKQPVVFGTLVGRTIDSGIDEFRVASTVNEHRVRTLNCDSTFTE